MQSDTKVSVINATPEEWAVRPPEQKKKRISRAQAVNQHCKDCIYDPSNGGNWRQQVEACTVTSCALYDIRPVSNSRQTDEDIE